VSGESPDFGKARDFYTFAPETLAAELPAFDLIREVGKGSMGIVFEARQKDNGRIVALKVLPPSLTLTERALARFMREGLIMSRVQHPDIVDFIDQGRQGRLHWFAMEFVAGVTLEQRLQVGPVPVLQACAIAAKVGRALQFAHDRGVVHRDIKPGNIMLRDAVEPAAAKVPPASDGDVPNDGIQIAITDFGLARETGTGSMTESGAIVGTPMYMAPEIVLGGTQAASTLADVYALGATLYALVTGKPPFNGPTAQGVLKAVTEEDPLPARRLRRDLPFEVEAIIEKAMSRDPAHRYGSALELSEDLERYLNGERVLARRPTIVRRGLRWCARRPLITVLASAVLMLATGAAMLVNERNHNEIQREIADAERFLALAGTTADESGRTRSRSDRQDLLSRAVAAASKTIARDEDIAIAWFVRARAYHRLGQYRDAIWDLDMAQRLRGVPSAEILHFRIDALRQLTDRSSVERVQIDLMSLLEIDQSDQTRTLIAEHLLDVAEHAGELEQEAAVARIKEILTGVSDNDPRAAVARARMLETDGAVAEALLAMKSAVDQHPSNIYVHLQAARMFARNNLQEESLRAQRLAQSMQPNGTEAVPVTAAPVDFGGLGSFLGEVDRALDVLDDDKKKPKMHAQRQPGSTAKPKDSTAKPKDPGRGGDRGQ
jgi:serine/threonine protein kinase